MNKKILVFALILSAVFGLSNLALAQSTGSGFSHGGGRGGARPGVFGTVTAVNGDTITVQSKGFGQNSTQTTYTVDATNATVTKNNATSSVDDIAVGDNIMVQGTVSGTNVTATSIRDGMSGTGNNRNGSGGGIFGTVASISGTSITVTGRVASGGGTAPTYTVDASSATVTKNGANSSVSDIAVGDTIMVQGTVNGTSVTATTIRDGQPQVGSGQQKSSSQGSVNTQNNNSSGNSPATSSGNSFWDSIVGFFKHLFGFK
jgi:hypothetical protein